MCRTAFIYALVLLTFSTAKCRKTTDEKIKTTPIHTATIQATEKYQDRRNEIDLMDIMKECNETFRIQMSYLEQLNNSGSFPDETDKTPKCYVRCVLEASGVASGDGQFDPTLAPLVLSQIRDGFNSDELQDMATECMDRKETCKCERSYEFIKCIMEKEIEKTTNTTDKTVSEII